MPQVIIYLNYELDEKIKELSKDLDISKHDAILKILEDYKYGKNNHGTR